MNDNNYQLQVKAAEYLVEYVSQELSNLKSSLIFELFGLRTIKDFNKITGNTTEIVDGNIRYKKDIILKQFACFFSGFLYDILNSEKSINARGVIRTFLQIGKNTKIIYYNSKIIKENKRIRNVYIYSKGEKNIYNRLTKEKDVLLLELKNKSEDEIEFYGGIESYIQTVVSDAFLHQIVEEFKKDMKKTKELIKKRNDLLSTYKKEDT